MHKYRLLVFASHPIQYQAPLFRALAKRPEIDLEVCFYSRWGVERHIDPQFGVPVAWDIPLVDGYRHRFLKNIGLSDGPGGLLSLINPGVLPLCLAGDADAVWMQGWALGSNWLVWLATTIRQKALLIRGESNGLEEPKGCKGVVKQFILKALFSQVTGFLSIGRLNCEFYRSYGIPLEKIFLTPYVVDNDFFLKQSAELTDKESLRSQYGLHPDHPVVLYTGKLISKKRPMDLIRAFANMRASRPCSLAIVGDGALRAELEAYVREQSVPNVHFLGFRNQREIGRLYALADVFAMPSSSEPWGLSVNEAMCFSLPIVATDQVGSGFDLIEHGVNGYHYKEGDTDALASYLQQTLASESHRRRMGAQSRETIDSWNIDRAVSGIVSAVKASVPVKPIIERSHAI